MPEKIVVKDLYKVFGSDPKRGLKMIQEGYSKDEILEKTRQTVGINNANFEIHEGEIFVIMGLSGSGKSTVLRCLNRLIEPTSGEIHLDGEDITRVDEEKLREIRRKRMGMVFQRFALFPHRTVIDNVAYGLEVQGVDRTERLKKAQEALEMVGLKGHAESLPDTLSGGMQQRVGLARGLVADPDVLLMDEPFSALDPLIRRDMQDELLTLQGQMNKTIVFVTHDLDEALKIGDRIALMKDGVVVQLGPPEEILTRPANEYVRRFVEDVDMARVVTAERVMKPAEAVTLKDGPRVALRRMQERGLSALFVVTRERKLAGIVTAEDALEAAERQDGDLNQILITDVPRTSPDVVISEIIPILADSKLPLAVVGENERLLGAVVRGSLLAGLIRKDEPA